MRLLAEHCGQKIPNIFDALVKPWVANAMGCELAVLPYDTDLSNMQIISFPEVHGGSMSITKAHHHPHAHPQHQR